VKETEGPEMCGWVRERESVCVCGRESEREREKTDKQIGNAREK